MRNPPRDPKLKLQFFANLPSDLIIDIISRLPIRTIGIYKCVCKSWADLLRSREFADFRFSKSVPGLVMGYYFAPKSYKILEFDDELGLEDHHLHYNPVTEFDSSMAFPGLSELKGSAKGLLFFVRRLIDLDDLYICNPMTRQHKVVRICHDFIIDDDTGDISRCAKSVCLVYALGTGMWRSVAFNAPFLDDSRSTGVSLSGNLYWLVKGVFDHSNCISCFDLETETFSTFSPPPIGDASGAVLAGLGVLGDCLCVCDNALHDDIVIWLMKDYGDEKSWTKEFVIRKSPEFVTDFEGCYVIVYPIKLFRNGDILMAWHDYYTIYYSKTKTTMEINMFGLNDIPTRSGDMAVMLHTSSFLSLQSFPNESVRSF